MNVLLSLLQKSTDYNQLLKAVEAKQAVAVSGLSQAPRSHVLAAVHEQSGRPLIAVCQDDMAAKRLASELGAFFRRGATGSAVPRIDTGRSHRRVPSVGAAAAAAFIRAGAGPCPGAGGESRCAAAAHNPAPDALFPRQ